MFARAPYRLRTRSRLPLPHLDLTARGPLLVAGAPLLRDERTSRLAVEDRHPTTARRAHKKKHSALAKSKLAAI